MLGAALHAGDILAVTKQMDAVVTPAVGFQAFKTGTGLMQNMRGRAKPQVLYGLHARIGSLAIAILAD